MWPNRKVIGGMWSPALAGGGSGPPPGPETIWAATPTDQISSQEFLWLDGTFTGDLTLDQGEITIPPCDKVLLILSVRSSGSYPAPTLYFPAIDETVSQYVTHRSNTGEFYVAVYEVIGLPAADLNVTIQPDGNPIDVFHLMAAFLNGESAGIDNVASVAGSTEQITLVPDSTANSCIQILVSGQEHADLKIFDSYGEIPLWSRQLAMYGTPIDISEVVTFNDRFTYDGGWYADEFTTPFDPAKLWINVATANTLGVQAYMDSGLQVLIIGESGSESLVGVLQMTEYSVVALIRPEAHYVENIEMWLSATGYVESITVFSDPRLLHVAIGRNATEIGMEQYAMSSPGIDKLLVRITYTTEAA